MDQPRKFRFTLGGLLVLLALIAVGIAVLRPLKTTRITDVKVGTGPAVKEGDTLVVHYVGQLVNGKTFDDSKSRGQPLEMIVGRGMVIKGWDIGLLGMRVGGVRKLTIPPSEAYGEKGAPPVIPSNSTLYFEVDLLGIK